MNATDLDPSRDHFQEAALKALSSRVGEDEVKTFLKNVSSKGAPAPLYAEAWVNLAIYGKVDCKPDIQPYSFHTTIWGGPAYFGNSLGFLYTGFSSWEEFFRSVNSCHVQGIAAAGGVLQINWLTPTGTPMGQFNGVAGGIGLMEAGGEGQWQRR